MYYDNKKADRTINFFKHLKHTKGSWAGVPFLLLTWQEKVLCDIFGTMRDDGYRQYNTAYIELPKKQGKSETAAGIALYCLTADDEQSAEVYGCAADKQQASIVFDVAVAMVEQSPILKKHIRPILSQKRLVYKPTRSYYQVLSAESYTKHGLNVHCCVFDELHAQPNRDLYDVMTEGSGDARKQPLFFFITTAGDDPDRNSIGWEVHQMALDILTDTKIDQTFYALIYGLDKENKRIWKGQEYETYKEINWKDPKLWAKINPSLNHTVSLEKVKDQCNRAAGSVIRERNFHWLRLNSWEKIKTAKWLGIDFWDLCKGKVNTKHLEGRTCYGGLDLSSKIDMTAFVLVFPPDDINKKWAILPWFWVPEERIRERTETDKVPYETWVQQGLIKPTPGDVIDYDFIKAEILKTKDIYDIQEIGFDPWNAMQVALQLQDEGLTMVEVRQGFKTMSPVMKEIERLVRGKEIVHNGHPVLRWNVGNVEVKQNENEDLRPVKGKNTERIDGLVAMINALDRAMRHQNDKSVYEKRGMRSLL